MAMDPSTRSLRARVAAHTSWAATPDRTSRTAPARAAANAHARFEHQVDPDRVMTPEARALAAASARSAHFAAMALKSQQARKNKKGPPMTTTTPTPAADFDIPIRAARRNAARAATTHRRQRDAANAAIWRAELAKLDRLVSQRNRAAAQQVTA